MNNRIKILNRIGLVAIFLMYILYFTIIIYKRPWIDCDLYEGIVSLNNYLHGLGWHQSYYVSGYKIGHSYLTYWPPGQYLYPYIISKIFSLNIANGIIISNILFLLIGFILYYILLKSYGFDKSVIIASILLITAQRFFEGLLLKMNGVDIYLIAFTAGSLILYRKLFTTSKLSKQVIYILLLLIIFLLGIYTKNSFLLFVVCSSAFYLCFYSLQLLSKKDGKNRTLFPLILLLIIAAGTTLCYYFLILNNGRTPFDKHYAIVPQPLNLLRLLNIIIKPIIETLGSVFSFDALLLRFPAPTKSYFSLVANFTWQGIIISSLLLLPFIYSIYKFKNANKSIFYYLTICMTLLYAGFFAVSIVKQTDVYPEDRLFLPVILLLMPVYLNSMKENPFLRISLGIFIIVSLAFSAFSIPNEWRYYDKSCVVRRNDIISGFMLHSENEHFNELHATGDTISKKFQNNNILMSGVSQDAFLTNANEPIISMNFNLQPNINKLIEDNTVFFKQHNIIHLSVLTNIETHLIVDSNRIETQYHSLHYSLLVLTTK